MQFVRERLGSCCSSSSRVITIVYATLMLDNMLLTAVVPVLPEYFFKQHIELLESENVSQSVSNATVTIATTNASTALPSGGCTPSSATSYLSRENLYIGILFASKPLVQILTNIAVGPITDIIGFNVPMFVGYVIIFTSATIFAFGTSYPILLVARALQGIGSACSSTAGMGMVADSFKDDEERVRAIGLALGGLAMGVLIGPVFASVVYQLAGKEAVFLVLAVFAVMLAVIQICLRSLKVERRPPGEEGTPLATLLCDPYIAIVAATIMLGNTTIGMLESGQPIWMIQTMCAKKWELGIAFLPESISYLIVTNLIALCCQRAPLWSICMIGIYMSSVGSVTLPLATSLPEVIGPGLLIGSAVAMVDTSMFPVMATLVDTRHKPVYGSVYAIADVAFCIAFIIGPLVAGAVISVIGFTWLMRIVSIVTFLFAPLVLFLRNPPKKEETLSLLYNATPPARTDEESDESTNGRMTDVFEEEK